MHIERIIVIVFIRKGIISVVQHIMAEGNAVILEERITIRVASKEILEVKKAETHEGAEDIDKFTI